MDTSLLDYIDNLIDLKKQSDWIIQITLVIFLSLLASFIASRFMNRLIDKLKLTKNVWDDALFLALRKPVRFIIWIVGISYAGAIVYEETEAAIFSGVDVLRDIGVIGCLTWFLLRFIQRVEDNVILKQRSAGKDIDQTTADAIANIMKATVVISAMLVSLQTLGFSIEGVLAFGGVGGIAVGIAAKDMLANFFGAMIVYLDRPFSVGDWVRSSDHEIEGVVEKIGWRVTVIRTFDKRPLYVPNSLFTTIVVENPSRMTHRRIYETIGVRYGDMGKARAIVDDVRQMLIDHPEIDKTQTMIVHVNQFNASSVDFFVYTFTHTVEWVKYHGVKEDVLLKIAEIIEGHGADIAFPTRMLHLADAVRIAEEQQEPAKA